MVKLKDDEFHYLVDYLKKHFGINLVNKRVLIEGRLSNYLLEQGHQDYGSYIKALQADRTGRELANLLNKVTTNHTFFMREADHFDYFRTQVLPILERSVKDRDLRIWCAACSSGEESYTLAMILNDHFGGRLPAWDKKLLASDLSLKVLDQARAGIYSAESVKSLPPAWLKRYFTQLEDGRYQVVPDLRNEVVYRQFNLMEPIAVRKPYQVIFCRNVMIYFDNETKMQLVEKLYDSLCPGGFLFIGHTETIPKPSRFNYIMPSIYQKGV